MRGRGSENSFSFCWPSIWWFLEMSGFYLFFECFPNNSNSNNNKTQTAKQWLDNGIQFPNRRMFSFDRVKNAKCAEQLAFDCGKTMAKEDGKQSNENENAKKNKHPKRNTALAIDHWQWERIIVCIGVCFCLPSFPKHCEYILHIHKRWSEYHDRMDREAQHLRYSCEHVWKCVY